MKERKGYFEIKTDEENGKILEMKVVFDEVEDNVPKPSLIISERDKAIHEMRFSQVKTLQEIGDHFNLTRERVRQILDRINETNMAVIDGGYEYNGDFKINLRGARANAGLTREEASDKLGISGATIRNYENYQSFPTIKTLIAMSHLYKVPIDKLELSPKEDSEE